MVSARSSRIWGINRICTECYKSFLARNPLIKRCEECKKDDFFDNNTEEFDEKEAERVNHLKALSSLVLDKAEEELLVEPFQFETAQSEGFGETKHRSKQLEQSYLDQLGNILRNEVWE